MRLLPILLTALVGAGALADEPVVVGTKAVAKDVYAYTRANNGPNSGFVAGAGEVLVIDPGPTPSEASRLMSAIRKETNAPIRYVVNTNYYSDSTFGNQVFSPPATVIAHPETRALFQRRWNMMKVRLHMEGEDVSSVQMTLPTKLVREEDDLSVGGRNVRLIPLPGARTPGDLAVYLPDERVLFTGGLVEVGSLPDLSDAAVKGWIDALAKLAALDVAQVVPGRGPVSGKEAILNMGKLLADLSAAVDEAIKAGKGVGEAKRDIRLDQYRDYPGYEKWLPKAIEAAYKGNAGGR
jgi:cyclase